MLMKTWAGKLAGRFFGIGVAALTLSAFGGVAVAVEGPTVGPLVVPKLSPAFGSLPKAPKFSGKKVIRTRLRPAHAGMEGASDPQGQAGQAALAARSVAAGNRSKRAIGLLSFDGQGNNCGCSPPDTSGDVGPNHYVQAVNATEIAIYDKSGSMLAGYPKSLKSLWASTPGSCDASNDGDPTVLYDQMADRWILSQFFEGSGNGVCIAVSTSGDPTGSYNLYEFSTPQFPDYFKIGAWPNAYYMTVNEPTTYSAYALDRTKMLAGQAATFIRFGGETNFLLPADVDGSSAPAGNAPGLFYTFKDSTFHGGASDRLEVFSFTPDFVTPGNSTFALSGTIPITSFTYTVCGFFNLSCIPQNGTTRKVDAVSEWPMHRLAYRKFSDHEALVGNFTVESATTDAAAIRWFELRNTGSGWSLFQEGTVDSNDGVSRFMGSIAMDGNGNIGLGYSVSSASMFPAIRYSMHAAGDASGTMQAEQELIGGGGSQTGSSRWGDYSAMSVDPADDATFWYTQEYYPASASSAWHTRIGSFSLLNSIVPTSTAADDGFVTESTAKSNKGGAVSASSVVIKVGDTNRNKQMKGILDFDTSPLPDMAVVKSARIFVKSAGAATGKPFKTLGSLKADIKNGNFGSAVTLEPVDFQSAAGTSGAATLPKTASAGWYSASLSPAALAAISLTGHTQIRLRFTKGDDRDGANDYVKFVSGDAAADQPYLVIGYQ